MPGYIWTTVLIGVTGALLLTCYALYRGGRAAGVAATVPITMAAAGGWVIWVAASWALAGANVYRQEVTHTAPWLGVAFLLVVGAVLGFTRIPAVAQIIAGPDTLWRLALPQCVRILSFTFFIDMALGKLPAVFAVPAGLGDMATGIAALLVARNIRRGVYQGAMWFNIFGLLDLAVAFTLGFLAGVGPTQVFVTTPTTEELGLLPLAIVPTVSVPLAVSLHLTMLARLRSARHANTIQDNGQTTFVSMR